MKKLLLLFSLLFGFCYCFSQANEIYFTEGFEQNSTWPSSAAASLGMYVTGSSGATFYTYGAYRSPGPTGSCASLPSPQHLRFGNLSSITSATDSAYVVSPVLNAGVYQVHFLRGRTSRRFTIFKTTDTLATTANWVEVAHSPVFAFTTCVDTAYTINDATAKRIKIVARAGTDSDIDSLYITSMTPLPVKFAGISASTIAGSIQINWKVATELNINNYEIERSADGRSFSKIGNILSAGNSTVLKHYTFTDNAPLAGINFYRIKAVEKDGKINYTTIVKVNTSRGKIDMVVAPNPVKGNELNVQFSSITKGTYTLSLYNNTGQEVFSKQITSEGGSLTQTFVLPASVKPGMYNLQLSGTETRLNKKILVE